MLKFSAIFVCNIFCRTNISGTLSSNPNKVYNQTPALLKIAKGCFMIYSRIKGRSAAHARGATAPLMYFNSGLTSAHLLNLKGSFRASEWLKLSFLMPIAWPLSKMVWHTMIPSKHFLLAITDIFELDVKKNKKILIS